MSVQQIPRRWEEPWGQLAMDEMTANFGTTFAVTGTEVAITDLQLSVDIPPGRRLRVTLVAGGQSTTGGIGQLILARLRDDLGLGGSSLKTGRFGCNVANSPFPVVIVWHGTSDSRGTYDFGLTMTRDVGGGTCTSTGAATNPSQLVVEDLGPA